jgi:hypothetical protein
MPKKEIEPVVRVHIWIYEKDWEELKQIYGSTTGPSKAIRAIVRNLLNQIRNRVEAVEHKLGGLDL